MRIPIFRWPTFTLRLIALVMLVTTLGPTGDAYADPSDPLSGDVTDIPKPDFSTTDTAADTAAEAASPLPILSITHK